jgi:ABC-2 type transport system permease protein
VNGVLATFRRELRAYFFSPLAYVVLCFFLLVSGAIFIILVNQLNNPASPGGPPLGFFFQTTWLLLLLIIPVLTMRLISEELRSGSIEVLMTAPVTEAQVVGGKFLAALTFYGFLWLPTVVYGLSINLYEKVDWGPVGSGYLGILLIGSLLVSIGVFASATTRSQLLAAMITVALILLLFLASVFGSFTTNDLIKKTLDFLNIWDHIEEFSSGIIDTRRLVFYLSGTLFFLFLASRALEDKKWR